MGVVIDGVIRNATIEPVPGNMDGLKWARGLIYDDRKGRFDDGHPIHTSSIVSGPDENGIIRTRNSTYRLEMAT
jgi:hypothetical protein